MHGATTTSRCLLMAWRRRRAGLTPARRPLAALRLLPVALLLPLLLMQAGARLRTSVTRP